MGRSSYIERVSWGAVGVGVGGWIVMVIRILCDTRRTTKMNGCSIENWIVRFIGFPFRLCNSIFFLYSFFLTKILHKTERRWSDGSWHGDGTVTLMPPQLTGSIGRVPCGNHYDSDVYGKWDGEDGDGEGEEGKKAWIWCPRRWVMGMGGGVSQRAQMLITKLRK